MTALSSQSGIKRYTPCLRAYPRWSSFSGMFIGIVLIICIISPNSSTCIRFYITQRRELDFTWEMMEQLISECNLNMDSLSFRCVVHPKSLVDSIISVIPQHIRLATKGFSHILSVLVFQDEEGNTSYDFGIAPKEYLFDFDEAIAKVDKDNQISRAQYKLMEALDRTKTKSILTSDSFALDIGVYITYN